MELAEDAGDGMLTFGIVTALWFASGGVNSMISALNLAVSDPRGPLLAESPHDRARADAGDLDSSSRGAALCAGERPRCGLARSELGLQPVVVVLWKAFQWPTAVFFVLISNSLIFYFGPNLKERRWHWITPGSAFGAIVWLAASIGFRIYLHFFNSYNLSYGSLGAVMILLAWLYVTGLAFLIGGEINAVIDRAMAQEISGMRDHLTLLPWSKDFSHWNLDFRKILRPHSRPPNFRNASRP